VTDKELLPIPLLSTGKVQIRDFTLDDMRAYARANMAAYEAQRRIDEAIVIDWEYETDDPLVEIDAIHTDYAKSFGTYPGPEMARIVGRTRLQLFHWWAWHREAIRAALVVAKATVPPAPRVARRLSGLRHAAEATRTGRVT